MLCIVQEKHWRKLLFENKKYIHISIEDIKTLHIRHNSLTVFYFTYTLQLPIYYIR